MSLKMGQYSFKSTKSCHRKKYDRVFLNKSLIVEISFDIRPITATNFADHPTKERKKEDAILEAEAFHEHRILRSMRWRARTHVCPHAKLDINGTLTLQRWTHALKHQLTPPAPARRRRRV